MVTGGSDHPRFTPRVVVTTLALALALGAVGALADGRRSGAGTIAELCCLAVSAAILARVAGRPLLVPFPLPLALIGIGAGLSLVAAEQPDFAATADLLVGATVAVVACQVAVIARPAHLLAAGAAALALGAFVSLAAWVSGFRPLLPYDLAGIGRLGWPFGHPNALGAYMAVLLPPVISALVLARLPRARLGLAAAVLLGVVALAMSLSRGAWIAVIVGLGALGLYHSVRRVLLIAGPAAAVGGLVLSLRGFGDVIDNARRGIWADAVRLIGAHPLTGIGVDNFKLFARPQQGVYGSPTPGHAHDLFLSVAVELGLVGAAGLVLLFVFALLAAHRVARSGSRPASALGSGLVGALVAFAVAGLVNQPMKDPRDAVLLWALVGTCAGAYIAFKPSPAGADGPRGVQARAEMTVGEEESPM